MKALLILGSILGGLYIICMILFAPNAGGADNRDLLLWSVRGFSISILTTSLLILKQAVSPMNITRALDQSDLDNKLLDEDMSDYYDDYDRSNDRATLIFHSIPIGISLFLVLSSFFYFSVMAASIFCVFYAICWAIFGGIIAYSYDSMKAEMDRVYE